MDDFVRWKFFCLQIPRIFPFSRSFLRFQHLNITPCKIVFALFSDSTVYHKMFEDKIIVYSTLFISSIASVVNIILLFGIICFEKNHHYRTLINQLVTSMYWYGILWIISIQIPTTLRYLVASFPPILCSLDVILRNVFMMQVLFFLDAVLLCRYIFIFEKLEIDELA